jgi:RNA polymerase sigma-70 factor (ECF subfamily)
MASDKQAFMLIYDQYFNTVKKYILIAGYSPHGNAEDIAQDIFLKLWQKRETIGEILSLEDYLFSMVRNRIINEKKKARTRQKLMQILEARTPVHCHATEDAMNYRETVRLIDGGIRQLPPRAKLAWSLKEQAGLKNDAIARAMRVSKSVVKHHLQVANKKINISLCKALQ